jgi:hypothetical protein
MPRSTQYSREHQWRREQPVKLVRRDLARQLTVQAAG